MHRVVCDKVSSRRFLCAVLIQRFVCSVVKVFVKVDHKDRGPWWFSNCGRCTTGDLQFRLLHFNGIYLSVGLVKYFCLCVFFFWFKHDLYAKMYSYFGKFYFVI